MDEADAAAARRNVDGGPVTDKDIIDTIEKARYDYLARQGSGPRLDQ